MKEIEKEDLDRLEDFEKTILNLQDEDSPSYSIDYEMESQIRYDVLIDSFDVSSVYEAFKKLNIDKNDLWNHSNFVQVYNYIDSKK